MATVIQNEPWFLSQLWSRVGGNGAEEDELEEGIKEQRWQPAKTTLNVAENEDNTRCNQEGNDTKPFLALSNPGIRIAQECTLNNTHATQSSVLNPSPTAQFHSV